MFTDNPVWGFGFSATGLKAVRNNVEYMFEVNTVFEFSDCKLNKSAVACQATLTNDCWGVYVPRYDVTFGFKEGRIAAFGGSLNNSAELAAIPTAPPPSVTWLDWARQNLPDDFAKYSDNEWAKFSGTGDQASGKLSAREFGQVVDRMCKGYAEAMK